MDEGNGGDLEIHCPNAQTLLAQTLAGSGRLRIEREDVPTGKEVK